jgi:putative transposase
MYRWRRMTVEQRREALEDRQRHSHPWHGPPRYVSGRGLYLLTAACYEHQPIIGANPKRMADFESALLETIHPRVRATFAWTILPNHYHYHLVFDALDIQALLQAIGQFHGRTSFQWNGEDNARGRKVWHRAAETAMKSEGHFWATLNYVLNNAVRHGYVDRWQDWPYSNAVRYLEEVGRDFAERSWRMYPALDYGEGWDPPDL